MTRARACGGSGGGVDKSRDGEGDELAVHASEDEISEPSTETFVDRGREEVEE
jgi:hypothetical protein